MKLRKTKPQGSSPTFERLNQERIERSKKVAEAADEIIRASREIVEEAQELIDRVRGNRRSA